MCSCTCLAWFGPDCVVLSSALPYPRTWKLYVNGVKRDNYSRTTTQATRFSVRSSEALSNGWRAVGRNHIETLWRKHCNAFLPQPKCPGEWWTSNFTKNTIGKNENSWTHFFLDDKSRCILGRHGSIWADIQFFWSAIAPLSLLCPLWCPKPS